MPNWVVNKVRAPADVVRALLNADGDVDFRQVASFAGPHDKWDSFHTAAETAASAALGLPLSSDPLLAELQKRERERVNIKAMPPKVFAQFVGMLENFRASGHLHSMDFQRDAWGTKWNACRSSVDTDGEGCRFETAWTCPRQLLTTLSQRFPEAVIVVTYADEDIGYNCGTVMLRGGQVVKSDISARSLMAIPELRKKWQTFARDVWGRAAVEDDEDEDESEDEG